LSPFRFRSLAGTLGMLVAGCATPDRPASQAGSYHLDSPMADTNASARGWAVSPRSAGPVRFGVTPADGGDDCHYTVPAGAPVGLRFMAESSRVVRVDVDSAGVATDRGARVGMTEDEIARLYPAGLRTMPHKYVSGGHYLVFTPPGADSGFRIVWETDGRRVTTYRAGIEPAVEYVERCG
jgi:hypothetical protein